MVEGKTGTDYQSKAVGLLSDLAPPNFWRDLVPVLESIQQGTFDSNTGGGCLIQMKNSQIVVNKAFIPATAAAAATARSGTQDTHY